tara:strand:+ start:139 stop:336 length:198 start_codon:yes stop_codon:yes gene_type:complete
MNVDLKKYTPKEWSKILFIMNAIEDGWCVRKKEGTYIFSKHKGKEKQVYEEKYLEKFIQKYFKMN